MRIIVNGQQAFGKAALEALLERGDEVVGVFCAPDMSGPPLSDRKTTIVFPAMPSRSSAARIVRCSRT